MPSTDKNSSICVATDEDTEEKWEELKKELKDKRFFVDSDLTIFETYIDGIPDTTIEGEVFYRARKKEENEEFNKEDLTAPELKKCKAGRLNPARVSYLYISDQPKTAISEVRPWIGVEVAVIECRPKNELILKDFTIDDNERQKDHSYRNVIDEKFSKPISEDSKESDYLITQYIAEYIRDHATTEDGNKYDGIKYSSSANKGGYNIVIFEPDRISLAEDSKYTVQVKNVDFETKTLNKNTKSKTDWDKFNMENKAKEILRDVAKDYKGSSEHHMKGYISAYQLALEFEKRFNSIIKKLDLPVGGKNSGVKTSLSQYLARQLSTKIKNNEITDIEGAFLNNLYLEEMGFSKEVNSSVLDNNYGASLFRLK